MKRPSILLLITFLFGIFIVLALHIAAPKKENHKHAGFERVFAPEGTLVPLDTLDLGYGSYYIAGIDHGHLFLGNNQVPSHLVETNVDNLKDTVHHKISIPEDNLKYRSIQVKVSAPDFYVVDGVVPFIYRGSISDWTATRYKNSPYFLDAVPMQNGALALIGVNKEMEKVFYKVTEENPQPEIFPGLLKAQGDEAILSTSGQLHYDKNTKILTYVYLYRNQFFLMDTDLNLLRAGSTIDTISQEKINVGEISSENLWKISPLSLKVNERSCVHENLLYINSNILAGNEDIDVFDSISVIDVYQLDNGSYQFSFYIPALSSKKIREFVVVHHNLIVAKYKQHIITYKLDTSHTI
ncbi:hypothetical protein J0656_05880 [Muricauda ruestringensis]|uniref:Uncharacterized protein n=1 Tax=Flagellimonas aurea TaxID=2915619 RepID=A0ABS3G2A8_9FLAO|nr:hypothetical protein [Allomuricauda aurea]MBO0353541.1 hypothetical protein [Allomuricauda aurea]